MLILFKILILANILPLFFKEFYRPNVLPILFKILLSGECSLGASWCAATWRSLSAFCSKNLIEKRARPRSSRWEENKHLMMYQRPGCVSTSDIRIFKNILKAKLTRPSILCVTHQMSRKKRNYSVGWTVPYQIVNYKWYLMVLGQYMTILAGTWSV